MTVPPSTPPSTAPTSPTQPVTSEGDCVVDIDGDSGQYGYNEKDRDSNRSPPIAIADISKHSLSDKIKQCLPTSLAGKLPHIAPPWRKADGREKFISSIDDHPLGYPKLAAFMSSDPNFLMCRRFAFLHSRVLLHRQDQLAEMEKQLLGMDDEDCELDELALQSRRRDDQRPEEPSRTSLIDKIDNKLKDYDDLTVRIRRLCAIPRPSSRDYGSFYRWIDNEKPLCREETKFVKHQDDFIALAEKPEGGWFDGVLEDMLSLFPRPVTRAILSSAAERKKSDDKYVQLYSPERVDILVRLILTIVTVALLMAPTAVLFLVPEHAVVKLVVIVVFTLLFSAALGVFTKAKRHEMFAATAA
ncbi:MAG: hypothetical protein LQ338_000893 [Usnochroma carphineum]|nr:MAG: hypothetical protein LQ338_000893 [Usnochroma carphineum]